MRVLQINAVCGGGSTGRTCRELNDALVELGHDGLILYGNGSSDYEYARKLSSSCGVKLHGALSRLLGKNAAYSPFATGKALRIIREYKPDVVHLGNLHGNYINLRPLLNYLAKQDIPTVVTLHDCWVFTGKCTHYTEAGCNRWQTGCHDCPKLKGDIPSLFFDRTPQMWKEKGKLFRAIPRLAVTGVSDWITEEGRKAPCFANAKIIRRIYNWIDLSVFYPRESDFRQQHGIPEDSFVILCVSAGWFKDSCKTKDLIELAQKVGKAVQIVVAGSVSFAEELPENIKCIGYIHSTQELAELYSAADVYVHLSREDTFGKVIAEALSCGTPAVVYQATACPELVADGCGYVVETGDVDALAAAIGKIREDRKMTYSRACTEAVHRRFNKDTLVQDTIRLYEELCAATEKTK